MKLLMKCGFMVTAFFECVCVLLTSYQFLSHGVKTAWSLHISGSTRFCFDHSRLCVCVAHCGQAQKSCGPIPEYRIPNAIKLKRQIIFSNYCIFSLETHHNEPETRIISDYSFIYLQTRYTFFVPFFSVRLNFSLSAQSRKSLFLTKSKTKVSWFSAFSVRLNSSGCHH